jgi:hypothetical protein
LTRTIFDRPTTAANVVDLGVLEKSVRPLRKRGRPLQRLRSLWNRLRAVYIAALKAQVSGTAGE